MKNPANSGPFSTGSADDLALVSRVVVDTLCAQSKHTLSPGAIVFALGCLHRRARLVSISTRMLSTYRVSASQKAVAHSQGAAPFTLFETHSINFAIVVYAIMCTSMLDLH